MKKTVDAVIFIPFYEMGYDYHMLLDTIESIKYYVKESFHIVAIDDFSPSRLDERLRRDAPWITVLRNPKRYGGRSGIYVTQAAACKYALDNFDFRVFIRMDSDALMAGPSLVTEAISKLNSDPRIGILGSYTQRADGKKRNWYMWKIYLMYESSAIRRLLGKPVLWKEAIREAKKRGYSLAQHVLGGFYIISAECLKTMRDKHYLDYEYDNIIAHSSITDDVVFCLFCKAAGFEMADFGRPDQPMALALDIVPLPKEKIISEGKSGIHSVKKGFNGETQNELREYFRSLRK